MIEIEVKYDDDALRKEIDRLLRAGGDLAPVMIEIAGHLQDSVAESFQRQAAPPTARHGNRSPKRPSKSGEGRITDPRRPSSSATAGFCAASSPIRTTTPPSPGAT